MYSWDLEGSQGCLLDPLSCIQLLLTGVSNSLKNTVWNSRLELCPLEASSVKWWRIQGSRGNLYWIQTLRTKNLDFQATRSFRESTLCMLGSKPKSIHIDTLWLSYTLNPKLSTLKYTTSRQHQNQRILKKAGKLCIVILCELCTLECTVHSSALSSFWIIDGTLLL